MKTAEELAAWLDDNRHNYIFADYWEGSGAIFDLDAIGLARAILDFLNPTTEKPNDR